VNLPKGYGYVDYERKSEAEDALHHMNGGQIDGNKIKIEFVYIPTSKPAEKKKRDRSRSREKKKPAKKPARRDSSSSSSGSSSSSPSPAPRRKR